MKTGNIEAALWCIWIAIVANTCSSGFSGGTLTGIENAIRTKDCK